MYLPPRRPGTQLRRPYLIVGAIIGLFLMLAFSAGSALINKLSRATKQEASMGSDCAPLGNNHWVTALRAAHPQSSAQREIASGADHVA